MELFRLLLRFKRSPCYNIFMVSDNENILRTELACALQWTARLDMHEGVANHFSVVTDDSGAHFLINPAGRHFSRIEANDLLLLDANVETPPPSVDPTAWCLHATMHRRLPHARCLIHLHPPYATALASLADWRMLPIDQNSCRFFNRVAYDEDFGGMLLAEEEAARQCAAIGNQPVLVMRGHGVLTAAATVAEAFDLMYYFERSCRNQWLALTSGQKLFLIDDATAEKTAQQWERYPQSHLAELQRIS